MVLGGSWAKESQKAKQSLGERITRTTSRKQEDFMDNEVQALKEIVHELTKRIKTIDSKIRLESQEYAVFVAAVHEAKEFCQSIGTWDKVDLPEETRESVTNSGENNG